MEETELDAMLKGVINLVENWENASNEEIEMDGFDGIALDGVLEYCKNSEMFFGFEIYDIIMTIDGESKTDGELMSLAGDIARSMLRGEKYAELVPDIDFRQEYDDWAERYMPIQVGNRDLIFDVHSPHIEAAEALAKKFSADKGTNPFQHIWTIVYSKNNSNVVINGLHIVGKMKCLVCDKPWGNGNNIDDDIYIEAKY